MKPRGLVLFDIDGVIRDVTESYRLAIQKTVNSFCNWTPTINDIDNLKAEGNWNNDWDASLEMITRKLKTNKNCETIPKRKEVIETFSNYYFGGDPFGDFYKWTGFIKNEPLLVNNKLFDQLTNKGFFWGFVSGAEPPSAKFVLENRLKLKNPPLIAMGDAPEKPNPTGLLKISNKLFNSCLGSTQPPIWYLGDTVADVLTVKNAKEKIPNQKFISLAVAPPHLHKKTSKNTRLDYEKTLKQAGADKILLSTWDILNLCN